MKVERYCASRLLSIVVAIAILFESVFSCAVTASASGFGEDYDEKASAKETYDRTTYFDHVDIRVVGNLTLDGTTHKVTIQNVELKVVDPAKNPGEEDTVLIDTAFNTSTSYEWRVTEYNNKKVQIPKTAVVSLSCDIYLNGVLNESKAKFSFSGKEDFIQAIINCDGKQGLDFIISAEKVKEILYYDVEYIWSVADDNTALVEAVEAKVKESFTLPAVTEKYTNGDVHTLDTTCDAINKNIIIEHGGTYYRVCFGGWLYWSNEDTVKTGLADATQLAITSDTVIYGEWSVEELSDASTWIVLKKTISGIDNLEDLLLNNGWITILTPELEEDGTTPVFDKIEFSEMETTDRGLTLIYKFPVTTDGEYGFIENGLDIPGYERTVAVDAWENINASETLYGGAFIVEEYIENGSNKGIEVSLAMPKTAGADEVILGTVSFEESYKKKIGEDVHNYPDLQVYIFDEENNNALADAVFALTPVNDTETTAVSMITDASGYAKFSNIRKGEYTLNETTAPKNYCVDTTEYKITSFVKDGYPVEKYDSAHDYFVMTYEYDISISPTECFSDEQLLLTVYNNKIVNEPENTPNNSPTIPEQNEPVMPNDKPSESENDDSNTLNNLQNMLQDIKPGNKFEESSSEDNRELSEQNPSTGSNPYVPIFVVLLAVVSAVVGAIAAIKRK